MLDPGLVRVTIEELSVQAYLGVHDCEQQKPTEVKIDLEFEYKRPTTDTLGAAIDYAALRDTVLSAIKNRRFALVETVAETILDAVKIEFQMTWVSVRVRKLGALRQASSVAAFVEWCQAEPANKRHLPR
jgi:7,8-dihydroneopterin aldolase/epimerase/oxygenase